jgi:hypothetical protein
MDTVYCSHGISSEEGLQWTGRQVQISKLYRRNSETISEFSKINDAALSLNFEKESKNLPTSVLSSRKSIANLVSYVNKDHGLPYSQDDTYIDTKILLYGSVEYLERENLRSK